MNREKLGSRLGFIMLSAGCAIGCGNVWKFPWMCGQYGGGSYPPYPREDRDQPERAALPQGSLGRGL